MTSNDKMDSPTQEDVIAGGVAFDDYFESIGKKAAALSNGEDAQQTQANGIEAEGAGEQKLVDEIESLCMNCHANVSYLESIDLRNH